MYHDVFATFGGSSVAQTRAAALTGASAEAVTAKLIDEGVEQLAFQAPPSAEGDTAKTTHPLGVVDPRDLAFQVLHADAANEGEREFVAGLRKLSYDRTPVPWTVRGPGLQAVIAFTGVEPADDDARDRFATILSRAIHLLTPAEGRGSSRRLRRGGAETFTGRLTMKLDELPFGTPIPRWNNSDRVSWPGMAKMLGLPLGTLARCVGGRQDVLSRVADGRLVLGQPYQQSASWRAAVKPARERLIAVIESYAKDGQHQPIPIEPLGRGKVLVDLLLDEAEVHDHQVRDALWCDQQVRSVLARVTAVVGTRRVGEAAPVSKPLLTLEELMVAGIRSAEEAFRTRNPGAGDNAAAKAGKDEVAFLRRAMRENGWTGGADVTSTLLGAGAKSAIARGCSQNARSDRNYLASMDRWTKVATALVAVRREGVTFDERLTNGIRKLVMSARSFAFRYEIPYDALLRWQRGLAIPTSHQLHFVYRIEKAFGLPRGELVAMLGAVRGGRNNSARKTVKLDDGRTVQLKRYLRFLPSDAIDWSEKRLREAVAEADRRHYGSVTVNTVRQKAVSAISRSQAPLDPSCPILAEWEDLRAFKTTMNDGTRYLCPKWEWKTSSTVRKNENHMKDFARWCAAPREQGGLGLHPSQISFILLLNHQVVMKYVFHRVLRFSHLTVDGKELGAMLGGTEHGFLGFVKSLLDMDYGWLTQSRNRVKAPEVIDVEFPLEAMSDFDGKFTVAVPNKPEICRVMDAALVERINTDWTGSILHTRRMVSSLAGKVERHYKMIRDPHKLVLPILNHRYPIAVVLRQVKDALDQARPITGCPMQHAKDYRNAVAMLLLVTVVFRSDTLRNMEWRADGTGHLIRTATGYDVVVGADRFKNGFCQWLFGPSYRRRDYERALGDWQSLTKILDYYLEVCRPILLKGRQSDLLFPTGQSAEKWASPTFNAMITNWTRTWSVRNERHGTGMSGVLPWGPHCIRDIVATHIILHYPGEERWELAAAILCTGVELVKTRYAFVNSKRELGKANGIYSAAFAMGFGDDDLASLDLAA